MDNPVNVPPNVLAMLHQDEDTQLCFNADNNLTRFSARWYVASAVHIGGDPFPALVILPKNACMWGANIGPIWIFGHSRDKFYRLLKVNASGLRILKSRTKNMNDIEVYAHNAVEVYTTTMRFNGNRYEIVARKSEKIAD